MSASDRRREFDGYKSADSAICNWCPFRKHYPGRIRRNYGIGACSRVMVTILRLLIGTLRDCIKSRGRLEAEVIVLRHQLNILHRLSPRRVRPNPFERAIFVCLYRHFPDIGNAIGIIRPETVIRWHRMGFRAWWRWKSRNPGGRPKIDPELRDLLRRQFSLDGRECATSLANVARASAKSPLHVAFMSRPSAP